MSSAGLAEASQKLICWGSRMSSGYILIYWDNLESLSGEWIQSSGAQMLVDTEHDDADRGTKQPSNPGRSCSTQLLLRGLD